MTNIIDREKQYAYSWKHELLPAGPEEIETIQGHNRWMAYQGYRRSWDNQLEIVDLLSRIKKLEE